MIGNCFGGAGENWVNARRGTGRKAARIRKGSVIPDQLLSQGKYNCLVAYRGDECVPVRLSKVAGLPKVVTPDHPLVRTARLLGTCLGDVRH